MKEAFLGISSALLFVPVLIAAEEPASADFSCSLVQGAAGVHVDGPLSEWDSQIVAHPLKWSKRVNGQPPDASTATARCLADDRFLYVGVAVSAHPLRFQTVPFNQAWRNDAVEVSLFSESGNPSPHLSAGLIRVSSDSSGRVTTEGSVSVSNAVHRTRPVSYPLLWEAVGVRAGLRVVATGYEVEVAIPRYSIGWAGGLATPRIAMNVRVRRSCGDRPCLAVIELAEEPYNISPISHEQCRTLSFERQLPAATYAFANSPGNEAVAALLFGAISRLDAVDPDGAIAILRQSQDPGLVPVMAGALMAAGHRDSAQSVLNRISPGEFEDTVCLWAAEQMAYLHTLQGAASLAEREYATLAASSYPAFQDIGVAGRIDLAVAAGSGDAAMATYQEALGGRVVPGVRSGSRIAAWLETQGRSQEAIDVLTRLSEGESAHDSERAWALLQLQSHYQSIGDTEKAIETAWRLQAFAPGGDPSGETGLRKLIATLTFGRTAASASASFSDVYRRFLEENPGAADPARQIAYAEQLQWEGKSEAAAELFQEVSRNTGARGRDRAAALLRLQRLLLDCGQLERSVEAGLALQQAFPRDFLSLFTSWQLMRAASQAGGMPVSAQQRVEDFARSLGRDLRSPAQDATDAVQGQARALLLQFEKELNQQ